MKKRPLNNRIIVKVKTLSSKMKGDIIVDTGGSKEEMSEVVAVGKDIEMDDTLDVAVGDLVNFKDGAGEEIESLRGEEGYKYMLIPYHSLKYKNQ